MREIAALARLLGPARTSRAVGIQQALGHIERLYPEVVARADRCRLLVGLNDPEWGLTFVQFLEACEAFELGPDDFAGVRLGTYDAGSGGRLAMWRGQDRRLGPLVS